MFDGELSAPSASIFVRETMDGIFVSLPRRLSTSRLAQVWLVGMVLMVTMLTLLLSALAMLVSVPLGVVLLPLPLPVAMLGYRLMSSTWVLMIDRNQLQIEGDEVITIPLEEVMSIELVSDGPRGSMIIHTVGWSVCQLDGLFVRELAWLGALIQHHAERRRAELTAQGIVVTRSRQAPTALMEMLQR